DAICIAINLMDQKLKGYVIKIAENKIRFNNNSRDNHGQQQQPFKRPNVNGQNVARAYTVRNNVARRGYAQALAYCNKCIMHHEGPYTVKSSNYKTVGHMTRDYKVAVAAITQRASVGNQTSVTCYECGRQGHYRSECPKLRNQTHRNEAGNKTGNNKAKVRAYTIGGGGDNPDSNVVMGTFLLNNHYVTMLFDSGADRSFVLTTFSALLDFILSTLDVSYVVELADGRTSITNVILKGCMLGLLGIGISKAITPLFETMMVQAPEEVGEIPNDTQDTPIPTQPKSSQPPWKHKSRRKQRKEIEVSQEETPTKEHIPTPSHDPLPSGEDRLQLNELMEICLKLSDRVLSLEQININLAAKIEKLKKRVKKLEGKKKKRTHGLKRLYKVNYLDGDEVVVDVLAGEKEEQSKKVTKTTDVEVGAAFTTTTTTNDELTLAQTLIEIKAAMPKALTTAATTVTAVSTRPKEKGIIMQDPSKTPSLKPIILSQQSSQPKDKGKAKMVEPERPLKRKEQIMMDE
nr:hypothetical protein [Tanacetum cinerariifolium]